MIDKDGNIYFTFICPMVDDDHFACIWKLEPDLDLYEVFRSKRSPSDIILSRSPDRSIFGAERTGQNPNYQNTLWRIGDYETEKILEASGLNGIFHIEAYAVSDNNEIYFSREGRIFEANSNEEINVGSVFNRVQLLATGPDSRLYIIADDDLYVWDKKKLEPIAKKLREDSPENIPFSGANILFDMTVDADRNVYLAYYGGRKVLKVSEDGVITTVLESKAPYSPHGVDYYNGELYVLESTIGDGRWWRFWDRSDDEIVPRIRKIDTQGNVSEVFSYTVNEH